MCKVLNYIAEAGVKTYSVIETSEIYYYKFISYLLWKLPETFSVNYVYCVL